MSLTFSPVLPISVIGTFAALALILSILWLRSCGTRALWRLFAFIGLCFALLNPSFIRENKEALKSIIAVVIDKTGSQSLGDRTAMTEAARDHIAQQLAGRTDIETRFIEVSDSASDDGTKLFSALSAALSDLPRSRIAGAILITDGVIHDIPASKEQFTINGPIHGLITGHPAERDRQIRFLSAPKFGIVGKQVEIRAIVEEQGGTGSARIVLRKNGQEVETRTVPTGNAFSVELLIDHGGQTLIELAVEPLPDELTQLNNRVVLSLEGIHDKLRVLLISGQPHPGERAWRNLLKSDPNVELVHFTILLSAEKAGLTPINELSLIAFPIHDLFVNRLDDFDLVIFDRYANQGYIPNYYFNNIAAYLSRGGAVLIATGPEYIDRTSLAFTPLGDYLPAKPSGEIIEQRFRPQITEIGQRHPVTRDIATTQNASQWSEWFRLIGADAPKEKTLMSGASNLPLLVLDKADKGRVAVLLSDQLWLWARGYEKGGPYLELQRRLVHWLLKEPSLDEEALHAEVKGNDIHITRQSMKDDPGLVTATLPDGSTQDIALRQDKPGLFSALMPTSQKGIHILRSGELVSFANIGPANPREFIDVFSSSEHMRDFAQSTGGSVRRLISHDGSAVELPRSDTGITSSKLSGSNWIGFPDTRSTVTRGINVTPIGTGVSALLILLGLVMLAWVSEGRRRD